MINVSEFKVLICAVRAIIFGLVVILRQSKLPLVAPCKTVQSTLFSDFINAWIEIKKDEVTQDTYRRYERALRLHVLPYPLAKCKLSEIKPLTVKNFVVQHKGSPYTKRFAFSLVKQILNDAVVLEEITNNPAKGIHVPTPPKKMKVTWTESELQKFLNFTAEHRLYPLFLTAIYTGMRIGEIAGLQWEDVDLDKGVITIKRTLNDRRELKAGAKTDNSNRTILIPEIVIEALNQIQKPEGYVFTSRNGTPYFPNNIRKSLSILCAKAEVTRITPHAFRRLHVTMLIDRGIQAKVVSERVGHKNIQITLNLYTKVTEAMRQSAIKAINGFTLFDNKKFKLIGPKNVSHPANFG
jgi:integrase